MAASQDTTAETIVDQVDYEMRNTRRKQYTGNELFEYLRKCVEMIYAILVDNNSELIATGSGSFSTVAGTEAYDLSSNSMGDLWTIYKLTMDDPAYAVYLTDASSNVYAPLEMVEYENKYSYLQNASANRNRPTGFYLFGDNMGLLPVADAVYTVTIDKYFPNYVPIMGSLSTWVKNTTYDTAPTADIIRHGPSKYTNILTTSGIDDIISEPWYGSGWATYWTQDTADNIMPFKNLFNQHIVEGMKIMAKNRENLNFGVDTALMELFQERAYSLSRTRRKRDYQMRVQYK